MFRAIESFFQTDDTIEDAIARGRLAGWWEYLIDRLYTEYMLCCRKQKVDLGDTE